MAEGTHKHDASNAAGTAADADKKTNRTKKKTMKMAEAKTPPHEAVEPPSAPHSSEPFESMLGDVSGHPGELAREIELLTSPSPTTTTMADEESPAVRPHKKKHLYAIASNDVHHERTPGTGDAELDTNNNNNNNMKKKKTKKNNYHRRSKSSNISAFQKKAA